MSGGQDESGTSRDLSVGGSLGGQGCLRSRKRDPCTTSSPAKLGFAACQGTAKFK